MKEVFVFDVDGTLTDSRAMIDPEFEAYMLEFVKSNDVYLVTGSDRNKTFEQIGFELYEAVKGVWQSNGADYWEGNQRINKKDYKAPYEFIHYLKKLVSDSLYPVKTGSHIEERTGMLNFSIVGRACTPEQRKQYHKWDTKYCERRNICHAINKEYPDLHASVGGEISIDIAPKDNNKGRVADILNKKYEHIHFFGDRMQFGGNDYPLALIIDLCHIGTTYPVESYKQTWEVLKQL